MNIFINNQQSTINNQQSTINNQQSIKIMLERLKYLDLLRIFSSFFIVFIHVSA